MSAKVGICTILKQCFPTGNLNDSVLESTVLLKALMEDILLSVYKLTSKTVL